MLVGTAGHFFRQIDLQVQGLGRACEAPSIVLCSTLQQFGLEVAPGRALNRKFPGCPGRTAPFNRLRSFPTLKYLTEYLEVLVFGRGKIP